MLLFPFSFLTTTGGAAPINLVAPSVLIVDENTKEISYTPGTWENADSVSFAWYMNNELQVGETGSSFIAEFGLDVKVIETATNLFGSTNQESNTVNIPPPPYIDEGSITWDFVGGSLSSLLDAQPVVDEGSITWAFDGELADSYSTLPIDDASLAFSVFGSVV